MKKPASNTPEANFGVTLDPLFSDHQSNFEIDGRVSDRGSASLPFDLSSRPRSELVTPSIAALALGVAKETLGVWRCTKRYPLRYVKIGRRVRYKVEDLLNFIESRAV